MLSQTAEYALRTVVFLADRSEAPVRIDEIAAALDIPRNYLSKVLYRLAQESVLTSTRGQGGGFRLASPAERIRLLDVIEPFDHIGSQRGCLLGRAVFSDQRASELHEASKHVDPPVAALFPPTTVADMPAGAARRRR